MERLYLTVCVMMCAAGLLTGCESLNKQRAAPQQPINPFVVDQAGIVPPPPTGSITPNTSFVPPSGATAFSPITNTNNTPNTSATTPAAATNTAATVYGSLTPSASPPVTSAPATAYPNTAPGTVYPITVPGDTPLPSVARSTTAQQGVASRLHDTSTAISSSVQTTSVVP